MVKLKCWKKTIDKEEKMTFFTNKKNDNVVYIIDMKNKKFDVATSNNNDYGLPSNLKSFKNKSQALKFANKYMKENDKC